MELVGGEGGIAPVLPLGGLLLVLAVHCPLLLLLACRALCPPLGQQPGHHLGLVLAQAGQDCWCKAGGCPTIICSIKLCRCQGLMAPATADGLSYGSTYCCWQRLHRPSPQPPRLLHLGGKSCAKGNAKEKGGKNSRP